LKKRLEEVLAENRNLKANLSGESDSLQRERTLRVQAEAEVQSLQQRQRELEAQILGLGIEKARLEQEQILGKIADLQRSLEEMTPATTDAAAPPGGRR
jgi:hypothetical protein